MKKVAVVTGASAGIGEAVVKRLIRQGYITYAAAGRPDRMANLEKLGAILLRLDLTDDSSIVQAVLPDRFNDWFMGAITKTLLKRQRKEAAPQAA